jgi:hypothetical protein
MPSTWGVSVQPSRWQASWCSWSARLPQGLGRAVLDVALGVAGDHGVEHLGLVGKARVKGFFRNAGQAHDVIDRGGGVAIGHEGIGGDLDDALGQQQGVFCRGAASLARGGRRSRVRVGRVQGEGPVAGLANRLARSEKKEPKSSF